MNCANHSDRERVAFCQNCGKPLCQECMRAVGSAVFCEPCLAAKLGAAGAVPPAGGSYAEPVPGSFTSVPVPPPGLSGAPNPMLAGLLGFIPGVGAMYNEQYAKGIVHLIVFAILVSLAGNNGIFGLFIAGCLYRTRSDLTTLANGSASASPGAWHLTSPATPQVAYRPIPIALPRAAPRTAPATLMPPEPYLRTGREHGPRRLLQDSHHPPRRAGSSTLLLCPPCRRQCRSIRRCRTLATAFPQVPCG